MNNDQAAAPAERPHCDCPYCDSTNTTYQGPGVSAEALRPTFEQALTSPVNTYSIENHSNTPDFILAKYIQGCLNAYAEAIKHRDGWYGFNHSAYGATSQIKPTEPLDGDSNN